ncbi:hypothetical protein HO173_002723 [Letharia columbiana]|uniref:Carrier domain-containing protein n=1 Tax=Letharia columbiana TaxID=112416 RepID=A0A8H6G1L1_9LECA|nr:uncharacterized protein HO173_002723 [Letharia columbiana]KAF6238851.1 hypothetical protein HO173_002723 [Letharia columbiana]
MHLNGLKDLLISRASGNRPRSLIIYRSGETTSGYSVQYDKLLSLALSNSRHFTCVEGFKQGSVVLLHFDNHLDNIIWFWSVLYAGGVPAMSTPFSNDTKQRERHICHLHTLLRDPICLTRLNLLGDFTDQEVLNIHTVETLLSTEASDICALTVLKCSSETNLALLMLTSGSTGDAKAVALSHEQILTAITSKSSVKDLDPGKPFLNWIGLDHVASMVEIHLQALYLNVDQIHIPSSEVLSDPLFFLELIGKHSVARSFAPNFFLAKIREATESEPENAYLRLKELDLSCLRFLATGGETNVVDTCDAMSKLLCKYGAPKNAITPGFGMTETCAGAIFNSQCPDYDLENGYEFASLGTCMAGVEIRITVPVEDDETRVAVPNEAGNLELTGPVVFGEYYNNPSATAEAFTRDGWFKTGDRALIDTAGQLNLVGRWKDTIIVNGVKYLPHQIETAVEGLSLPEIVPGYIICFPYRSSGMETENICLVYSPNYPSNDVHSRINAQKAIVQVVMLQTGACPYILPLDSLLLQKSTLGKFSRPKIRKAMENGDYNKHKEENDALIQTYRASHYVPPANEMERLLLNEFANTVELFEEGLGVEKTILEMGVTSMHLIRLKQQIEKRLLIDEIPIVKIMAYPTVRSLARAIYDTHGPRKYDPVVKLQPNGSRTPLWLVHPGVGEILVFLGLAKSISDRPIFALRARGFDGEPYFESINQAVAVYHAAIKTQQPKGPYALAGYSYGTMLAFEITKVLEASGDEVRFLGSFNLPPHIKSRMEQLNWTQCLLHLSYFLGLITEQHADNAGDKLDGRSEQNALAYIKSSADPARWAELSLSPESLSNWASLAFGLQSMARLYEPSGLVKTMDVFYATPLKVLALSRKEWLDGHLRKWTGFVDTEPRFHEVEGAHYTMIGPDHVFGFQKKLKRALKSRGV